MSKCNREGRCCNYQSRQEAKVGLTDVIGFSEVPASAGAMSLRNERRKTDDTAVRIAILIESCIEMWHAGPSQSLQRNRSSSYENASLAVIYDLQSLSDYPFNDCNQIVTSIMWMLLRSATVSRYGR